MLSLNQRGPKLTSKAGPIQRGASIQLSSEVRLDL